MKHLLLRSGMLLLLVFAASFGGSGTTSAEEAAPIKLGITPVDYAGQYFDITMDPGEVRELKVEVANFGTQLTDALTYATDVYSISGGGFGARLSTETASGTTLWVAYSTEAIALPAGEGLTRSFNVTVPDGTAPGEYITSLVVQNAEPTAATAGEGVAIRQVQRTVIAVAITVPGPRLPALTIDGFDHRYLNANSVITARLANAGNVRLKPAGEMVVTEASGVEVGRVPVKMDSVYSGDLVKLNAPFSSRFLPGDYLLSLTLEYEGGIVEAINIPLNVPEPTGAEVEGAPTGAQIGNIDQEKPASLAASEQSTIPWLPIACVIALGMVAAAFILRKRRPETTV